MCGKIEGQVKSMNYCLIFLGKNVNMIKQNTRMWVTENIMMELMTHTNKKMKWVFDETITHNVGWVERLFMSTLSQETQG